ncbi:glycoside hydrolase family 36 protein [Streptosporangium sp. CA-135522]|uniref:glycoside hydrolase family 36 protein n=1 Tax=Streptosporangium sp. CA-135522 TaxID=3240072 RepID=UPI003D8E939B
MSVTIAGLAPAPTEHLLDDVRLAVLTHAPGASASWELTTQQDGPDLLEIHSEGETEIRLSVPLGDAVGFWHPTRSWSRPLVADWAGLAHVSLVQGGAAGCLYDSAGRSMLAFAAVDSVPEVVMRFGVSEETKTFVVHLTVPASASPYKMIFSRTAPSVAAAMRGLRTWLGAGLAPVPEAARLPVYSTWYSFTQDVEESAVEAEAALAAELGCGVIIIDDGWQELGNGRGYPGVGDWRPDTTKFPDLARHVARVREFGLKYLLWIAPLLLGPEAECFPELSPYAPAPAGVPGAQVLDPRRPEVRRHVVELCTSLVADYGLDGLKLDFLDEVMVYAGTPAHDADITDVGTAMHVLLTELQAALEAIRPDVLIELRQPYVGPGMAPFGNMLRADDCPVDATANRVRTIDVGLLSVRGAVHADMLMWDPEGEARSAARQLIGPLHAVPQISARLAGLSEEHRRMVAFWLGQWRRLRPLLLDGEVEPGRPDELYPVITASRGADCVITVSADRVAVLDTARHRRITLVNGTAAGYLVLDVTGPGISVEQTVYDAAGSMIERAERRFEPGLCTLAVPPSGLAILEETQ